MPAGGILVKMDWKVCFVLLSLGLYDFGEGNSPGDNVDCPPTWTRSAGEGACHKLWPNSKKTWDEARQTCRLLNADLLKLSDKSEKEGTITEIMKYPSNLEWWIGLKRHGLDDAKWVWVDGETRNDTTKFIMWGTGEPNNHLKSEDCAEIWDNLLNDKHCETPLQFICEQPLDTPRFCDMADGWHDIYPGKNCYKLFNQNATNQDASSICASNGATLLSISDDVEQYIFSDHITESNISVWINLKAQQSGGGINTWTWSDTHQPAANSPYWMDGQPDWQRVLANKTNCVKMSPSISQFNAFQTWEPTRCEEQNSFVCEKILITCPPSYYKFTISKCLKAALSDSLLPWNEARGYCNLRGTSLLEIHSRYEMDQMNKLMFTMIGDDVPRSDFKLWLGLAVNGSQLVWDSGIAAGAMETEMLRMGGIPNDTVGCAYLKLPDCSGVQGNCDDSKLEWKVGNCNEYQVAVCTVPGDTAIKTASTRKPRYVCPDQYSLIENTCVRRHYGDPMDWFSARNTCQQDGSDLATVESSKKLDFLKAKAEGSMWIGLNDLQSEGNYFWSDETSNYGGEIGDMLVTNNYMIGDRYAENCIAYVQDTKDGKWLDFPCSFKNSFFCQIWAEWNIAFGKNARQSSDYRDDRGVHKASKAIDSCTTMSHKSGCCTHTQTENSPWWELDLGTMYPIRKVIIYRRYEESCYSCKRRMHDFRLFISNETDKTENPVFQDKRSEPPPKIILVLPEIHFGRYVRIDVPDSNVALSLCEIEVFSEDFNRPKNDKIITEDNSNCYTNAKIWKGKVRHGISGRLCQEWVLNTPHEHTRHSDASFIDGSEIEAKNYCRDPDGEGRPWCYTVDPSVRWEYCPIPHCNSGMAAISKKELATECGSSDWLEDGTGVCYRIHGSYTAADAESYCQAVGGELVIPQNAKDVNFIFEMISNLTVLPDSFFWLGLSYSTVSYTWRTVDQSKLDASFVKNMINLDEVTASVPNGTACFGLELVGPAGPKELFKWKADKCLKRHHFICKKGGTYVKGFTPDAKEVSIWNNPAIGLSEKTHVLFKFKGKSGARIIMKNTAVKSQIQVEINIGIDRNSRSNIVTKYKAVNGFPAPINESMYSSFWLSWAEGKIQIGEGSAVGSDVFLSGFIPKFAGFDYMSLSVTGSDVGYWKFLRENSKSSKRRNLAFQRPTWQSSTYSDISGADKGVDGCSKNFYKSGCCTHTENERKPWWEVDLGAVYDIGEIVMTKRWACKTCRPRMNQFYVHINTTKISASRITDDTIQYSRHDQEPLPVVTLRTPGARGRYVLIQRPDKGVLEFCELEIYEGVNGALCKRDWLSYDRQTCIYVGTDKVDWTTARSKCKAMDPESDLAVISSPQQELYLFETAASIRPSLEFYKFWFGFKSKMNGAASWWDGSLTNYTRLPPNQGLKNGDANQCFTTAYEDPASGTWAQSDCSTSLYYICSKTTVEPLTTTTVPPTTTTAPPTTTTATPTTQMKTTTRLAPMTPVTTALPDLPPVSAYVPRETTVIAKTTQLNKDACPEGWTVNPTTASCIYTKRQPGLDFLSSELECLKMQSRLASITSEDEEKFFFAHLVDHVKEEGKFKSGWAGFWIGAIDVEDEGNWKWFLYDEPWLDTIDWSPGQPDNNNGKEDCVMIRASLNNLGESNDAPCSLTRDGYMCKKYMSDFKCEDGWFYEARTRNCYLVQDELKSWSEARSICKGNHNGDLASILTEKEQEFLGVMLSGNRKEPKLYWVGANTDPKDDTWWWSDKSTWWMRVAWDDFEVDHSKACGGVTGTKSLLQKALLKNENCDVKLPFICKKRAVGPDMNVTQNPASKPSSTDPSTKMTTQAPTSIGTTAALADKQCGQGWEKRPNSRYCYKFGVDVQSWVKAEEICSQAGGTLLSITSNEEQHYIAGRLNGMRELPLHMWIGANDRGIEGKWTWVDGAIFAFFNWKSSEPNNNDNNEDCGSIITAKDLAYGENFGLWNDMNCDSQQGYICKKAAQQVSTTQGTPVTERPDGVLYGCSGKGWLEYGINSCYLVVQDRVSWKTASTECRIKGGDLTSISHELEQEFIFSQLPQDMYCFDIWENKTACSGWAKQGECTRNPIWMNTHCHKACNVCMHNCNDRYASSAKCLEWASKGECDINPNWMKVNCAASCGICIGAPTRGFWIGMYSAKRSHQYEWSDGTDVTYTNWDYTVNQPEYFAYAAGSCAGMFLQTGTWNDGPCDETLQGYVCEKPKQQMSTTVESPFRVGCTGDNTYGYGAYCYSYVKERKTYDDAQKYCIANGGYLAFINDRYIQSFLSSELVNLLQDYWIGLKFANGQLTWTNYTRGALKFINFAKSFQFPENGSCCFALTTYKPVGLWKDHSCTEKLPSICQLPREGFTTPLPTTQTTTQYIPCKDGWKEFGNNCYFFPYEEVDWYSASRACTGLGGNVISVESQEENQFLVQNMIEVSWLGLHDMGQEGTFIWSDGKPATYFNWNEDEPNNAGDEDCVTIIWNSKWNDLLCAREKNYVCKIPKGKQDDIKTTTVISTTLTTTQPDLCGPGSNWVFFGGFCYNLFDDRANWHEAVQVCMNHGGNLISIHSAEEQAFIRDLIEDKDDVVWIGFNDLDVDGIFRWNDGTATDFTDWLPGQPNDGGGGEKCVASAPFSSGQWHDYPCSAGKYVMCRRPQGPSSTQVMPVTPRPGGCKPEFKEFGNKCYYIGGLNAAGLKNWDAARITCQDKQASLTSIHSLAENAFITSLFHDSIVKKFWIGLNDIMHKNGAFDWADNSVVDFSNWAENQPSANRHYYNRQFCVEMFGTEDKTGLWNDIECDVEKAYVCSAYKDVNFRTNKTSNCPPGYQPYQDNCYKILTESRSWDSCQAQCSADGGYLVTLGSVYEKAFVESLRTEDVGPLWVGMKLHKYGEDRWVTGEPQTMSDLRNVLTNNTVGCLSLDEYNWRIDQCYLSRVGVCELPTVRTTAITTPMEEKICSNRDLFLYNNNCYYLSTEPATFADAQTKCKARNMDFVSIHSYNENNELAKMVNETAAKSKPLVLKFFIGMYFENNRDQFPKWVDHTTVNYLHIAPVFYDVIKLNKGETFCFSFDAFSNDVSMWKTANCKQRAGYICKMKADAPQTTVTTTTTTSTTTTTTPSTTTTTITTTTTTPSTTNTTSKSTTKMPYKRRSLSRFEVKDEGLSPSQVAAIVVGGIAFLLIIILLGYAVRSGYMRKYLYKVQNRSAGPSIGFDNALFSKGEESHNESVSFD